GGFTSSVVKMQSVTDPLSIDSAFSPWKNSVNTRWDKTYFYIESNGIAEHEMMAGITAWQQQVPLPQCYTGTNAWMIPLQPEIAAVPVPVNPQHFIRGAVAVAVNGIPIFNPYTNTGVDAFLDGQLDKYGGHSGRADDYHYHTAPVHLYQKTQQKMPIAFALDGFAVYGAIEPDGTAMKSLDANHGHFGTDGVYHYHASTAAPYMIGRMVGKVTEDSTLQIIPQPAAKGVRPALTPLKDATITSCIPNGNGNGYILRYTLNGQQYSVDYRWTPLNATNSTYTYVFTSPNGSSTTQTYTGKSPCVKITTSVGDAQKESAIEIYPNPVRSRIMFMFPPEIAPSGILECTIYSMAGKRELHTHRIQDGIDVASLAKGSYLAVLAIGTHTHTIPFIKE
ncbi:MAG: YHYH protein, partial [Candidatus Kapabacteria bacterium]|nr:YHYH protein [Candidatus Kapabacteria bacterium]